MELCYLYQPEWYCHHRQCMWNILLQLQGHYTKAGISLHGFWRTSVLFSAFSNFLLASHTLQVLHLVANDKTCPVIGLMTAPCSVTELWPLPLFCHPMSYKTAICVKLIFFVLFCFFLIFTCKLLNVLAMQLPLTIISVAICNFPFSLLKENSS